jgi:hypothetical protein
MLGRLREISKNRHDIVRRSRDVGRTFPPYLHAATIASRLGRSSLSQEIPYSFIL